MRVLRRLRSTGTSYTCRQYILAIPTLVALTLAGRAVPGSDNDWRDQPHGHYRASLAPRRSCASASAPMRAISVVALSTLLIRSTASLAQTRAVS